MVKLSLVSPKGNQGVRYFPHRGYLGLTPLRFEGIVRTQIEQDAKPIQASDIAVAVRCYEARQGRLGAVQLNVLFEHAVTLWHKPPAQDWDELGDADFPFRFSLPAHVAAPSTALYFQEYRIFWRIEAVLNHVPIAAVGCRQTKHFDLPLVRHDTPALPSPPSAAYWSLSRPKSRAPLRYSILVPSHPIGPLDIISVQLLVLPLDTSASVRSASAFVERRIHFSDPRTGPCDSSPSPYRFPSHPPPSSIHPHDHTPSTSSSNLLLPASSLSVHSGDSSRPLLQHHEQGDHPRLASGDRGITHIFAHAESAGAFTRDASGVWRHNLIFSWPDTKSNSRWAVGESVQTGLATVKFFLRVKLVVSSQAHSAETVELEDKELVIVSTNDSQRQLALARYSESANTSSARPKSKSPRGAKRDRNTDQLPSPPRSPRQKPEPDTSPSFKPPLPLEHSHNFSSPYPPATSGLPKVSRRPHTSAGPRDRPNRLDAQTSQDIQNGGNRTTVPARPETAHPTRFPRPIQSYSFLRQKSIRAPRIGSSSSVSSDGPASSQQHNHASLLFETVNLVDVQAWEQELARIESASRRNSADMLGLLSQRKKANVEQGPLQTCVHAKG